MLCLPGSPASALVWTEPQPVLALTGSGDVLAAATLGGVVLWDLSGGSVRVVTTAVGLPTNAALAACMAPALDELRVATANGLACGWFQGPWVSAGARQDEGGPEYYTCTTRPGGGWVAGGDRGRLTAWHHGRLDTLHVPTRGRVLGLSWFPAWTESSDSGSRAVHECTGAKPSRTSDVGPALTRAVSPARSGVEAALAFPVGLVAAVDDDGIWVLHHSGRRTDWIRIGATEGLPSERTRGIVVDSNGHAWVATSAGVARIGPGTRVQTFPEDSLLTRHVNVLLEGGDGCLYVGLRDGLARVDIRAPRPSAARVSGIRGPVVALAWTDEGLWWSDGHLVTSLQDRRLGWPVSVAGNFGIEVYRDRDRVWVGHPLGRMSAYDDEGWRQLGPAQGLPNEDVFSMLVVDGRMHVGTENGLYAECLGSHFVPVAGGPPEMVCAQVVQGDVHWAGGSAGLWKRDATGWRPVDMWPAATDVHDLEAVAGTLWVAAGRGGVAYHDGTRWVAPPRDADLHDAFFDCLERGDDGRIAFGTDRGVALWEGGSLRPVCGGPQAYVTTVRWWGGRIASGTHRGLWIHNPDGSWRMLGVLDGLPGAQIRSLAAGADGGLWVGTSRGVGWIPDVFQTEVRPRRRSSRHADSPGDVSGRRVPPGLRLSARWTPQAVVVDVAEFPGIDRLDVFDVRGRLVRILDTRSRRRFTWDTRDRNGRRVANGIYYLRAHLPEPAGPASGRVVLLR